MDAKAIVADRFNRIINTTREEIKVLIDDVLSYFESLKKMGFARGVDDYFFRLVIDELVENAIMHGNKCNKNKSIELTITPDYQHLEITITDEGGGYYPESLPNPRKSENIKKSNGRGIFILQGIADVTWNKKGNSVMVKM